MLPRWHQDDWHHLDTLRARACFWLCPWLWTAREQIITSDWISFSIQDERKMWVQNRMGLFKAPGHICKNIKIQNGLNFQLIRDTVSLKGGWLSAGDFPHHLMKGWLLAFSIHIFPSEVNRTKPHEAPPVSPETWSRWPLQKAPRPLWPVYSRSSVQW